MITYNATISACKKGAQWQRARALLQNMRSQEFQADVITYSGARATAALATTATAATAATAAPAMSGRGRGKLTDEAVKSAATHCLELTSLNAARGRLLTERR